MQPKISLPHSRQPATCPYSEPDRSIPCPPSPHSTSRKSILISSPHLRLGLLSGPLFAPFFSHIRAICRAYFSLFLFDHSSDICWRVQSISFWLCSLLQSPVTSSVLGRNPTGRIALSYILITCTQKELHHRMNNVILGSAYLDFKQLIVWCILWCLESSKQQEICSRWRHVG